VPPEGQVGEVDPLADSPVWQLTATDHLVNGVKGDPEHGSHITDPQQRAVVRVREQRLY
jgi:hypothetical protein